MLYRINKVYNYVSKCFLCGINNSGLTDLSFRGLATYQPCMDCFSLYQSTNIRRFNTELKVVWKFVYAVSEKKISSG